MLLICYSTLLWNLSFSTMANTFPRCAPGCSQRANVNHMSMAACCCYHGCLLLPPTHTTCRHCNKESNGFPPFLAGCGLEGHWESHSGGHVIKKIKPIFPVIVIIALKWLCSKTHNVSS